MNTDPQNPQGGHDVPLTPPPVTPPPAAPAQPAPAPGPAPRGSGSTAIVVSLAVFGGLVLLGTGATAAVAAAHDMSRNSGSNTGDMLSASTSGVSSIDLEVGLTNMTVQFGDVDEATMEIIGTRTDRWTLERDEDELVVRGPDDRFGWLSGDWLGGNWFEEDGQIVLTLPESLNDGSLDADFDLGAGRLDIQGTFDEVDIDMGAGSLSMTGAATSIDADIAAGHARVDLENVSTADFMISAGKLVATLEGTAPREVTVDVSAGSLELTVPDETYSVTQDVSAGSLDNRLDTSSSSRYGIDASVSAGSVILRPGN